MSARRRLAVVVLLALLAWAPLAATIWAVAVL